MCMVDYAEPADVSHVDDVRARKPHRCDDCRGPIAIGETYRRAKFLQEGYWSSFAMCPACMAGPARWLTEQCGGYCFAGVEEDLAEHWSERHDLGISDAEILALGRLVIEMRRRHGREEAQR